MLETDELHAFVARRIADLVGDCYSKEFMEEHGKLCCFSMGI